MKKISLIIFALTLLSVSQVKSQNYTLTLSYDVGIPMGDILNEMKSASPAGFDVSFRKFLGGNFTVGAMVGMNEYLHQFTGTQHVESLNIDVSGTQDRFLYLTPIMVNAGYVFRKDADQGVRPFIGLNIGTFFISHVYDYGLHQFNSNNWNFGLAPEVGIMANLGSFNITLTGRYNYGTPYENKLYPHKMSLSYFTINMGVGYCQH